MRYQRQLQQQQLQQQQQQQQQQRQAMSQQSWQSQQHQTQQQHQTTPNESLHDLWDLWSNGDKDKGSHNGGTATAEVLVSSLLFCVLLRFRDTTSWLHRNKHATTKLPELPGVPWPLQMPRMFYRDTQQDQQHKVLNGEDCLQPADSDWEGWPGCLVDLMFAALIHPCVRMCNIC